MLRLAGERKERKKVFEKWTVSWCIWLRERNEKFPMKLCKTGFGSFHFHIVKRTFSLTAVGVNCISIKTLKTLVMFLRLTSFLQASLFNSIPNHTALHSWISCWEKLRFSYQIRDLLFCALCSLFAKDKCLRYNGLKVSIAVSSSPFHRFVKGTCIEFFFLGRSRYLDRKFLFMHSLSNVTFIIITKKAINRNVGRLFVSWPFYRVGAVVEIFLSMFSGEKLS